MESKKKPESSNHCWGPESEKKFIDGLGNHRYPERHVCVLEKVGLLKQYIRTHIKSPYSHHKAGVKYAEGQMEVLIRG